MEISDWINVMLCILSFILAVISVITVIITIKQNSKMIKNSARPYIVIYSNSTYFQDVKSRLNIKGIGIDTFKLVIVKRVVKTKRESHGLSFNTEKLQYIFYFMPSYTLFIISYLCPIIFL